MAQNKGIWIKLENQTDEHDYNINLIEVAPADWEKFTLEELRTMVDGYIEVLPLANDKLLIINEEAKLKKLASNPYATNEFRKTYINSSDVILGNALIIPKHLLK